MKTVATKAGILCLAAGLLVGCDTTRNVVSNTSEALGFGSSDRVGDGLDEADSASINRKTASALEWAPAGKTVTWRSSASGASARITPGETQIERRNIETARKRGVAPANNMVLIGRPYRALRNANIRSAPGTGHRIVGGLAKGEKFTAIGKVNGDKWIMVGVDGKAIGYVFTKLVGPVKSAKRTPELRAEMDFDDRYPGGLGKDVIVETVTVATACRRVDFTVTMADGDSEKDEIRACRTSDGAWEIN